ncbi:peroxiredoxin [Luteimonas sp. e5]
MPRPATFALLPLLASLAACAPAPSADPQAAAATPVADTDAAAAQNPPAASDGLLQAGQPAPDFKADAWLSGEPFAFDLAEARGKGPVVVYFFPAAYTPGCNIEARLFSEAIERFAAAGASVIGVTAGNRDQLARFSADNESCAGKFPVAADPDARIAAEYGARMERKPEWSNRSSFAIDRDGRILAVHSDPAPEGHVEAMLAAVGAAR